MITGGRGWEGLHTASHSGWSTTLGWDPRRRATSIHVPKGTTRDSHTVGPGACGCGEGEGGDKDPTGLYLRGLGWEGQCGVLRYSTQAGGLGGFEPVNPPGGGRVRLG